MGKKHCMTVLLLFVLFSTNAQSYTQPVYATRKDSAIIFGDETPLNYCGRPFTLKMNMYKPVGDGNTQRPVVICVHGGAFTSGVDFNESSMNVMAREFARRGYVAVSINYREGHHLYPYGTGNPQFKDLASLWAFSLINGGSSNWNTQARLFVADSTEVIRSLYRAQQDVKAAIRKMKQRRFVDSTSACKVFLAGHSAGGISVLAAGLMDLPSEKPSVAGATATASNPNWNNRCEWQLFGNCVTWQMEGPGGRDDQAYLTHNPAPFNYNASSCYQRPDLGPVDGNVNLSSAANTRVMGVASMCGAVLDTNIFSGNYYPALFMYHQPADRVVAYNVSRPFSFLGDFFTPAPNSKWPLFYGSGWIKGKLNRMNYPAANVLWTYDNSQNDPLGTTTHDLIPSIGAITDSIARFFSRVMDTSTLCNTAILAQPVTFNAQKNGETALLQWTLNTEGDAHRFIVQHSSDGLNFSEAGSALYNRQTTGYSFTHHNVVKGANYYRLKVMNRDGSSDLSEMRNLFFDGNSQVQIFPNPAGSRFTIMLPNELSRKTVQVKMTNATGNTVLNTVSAKSNTIQVDCTAFPQGIYFVSVTAENEPPYTERLVKL